MLRSVNFSLFWKRALTLAAMAILLTGASNSQAFAETKILRVGFADQPGFSEVLPDGSYAGYAYELLRRLAVYGNFAYVYRGTNLGWSGNQDLLENDQIDILIGGQITAKRLQKFDFTNPVGTFNGSLSIRAGDQRFLPGDYENWPPMKIGMAKGIVFNEQFAVFAAKKHLKYTPVFFDDYTLAAKHLLDGDVDALVAESARNHDGEWILENFIQVPFHIMVKKNRTALLERLNHAIALLMLHEPSFLSDCYHKYFYVDNNQQVQFDLSNLEFIDQCKKRQRVFLATANPDRPPFDWCENGKLKGILPEIAQEVFSRTGLDIQWVQPASRAEYRKLIDENKIDIVIDSRHTDNEAERAGYLLSAPVISPSVSIIKRRDFAGPFKKLAILKNSGFRQKLLQRLPVNCQFVEFDSIDTAVEAVKNGQCDALHLYSATIDRVINKDSQGLLVNNVVPDLVAPFCFAIKQKGNNELAAIIVKAVSSLRPDFIEKVSLNYTNIPPQVVSLKAFLYRYPLAFFIPIILVAVLVGLGWWIRTGDYRRICRERNRISELLQEKTVTLQSIGDGMIVTNRQGKITMINAVAEKLTGWTVLEALGCDHENVFHLVSHPDGEPIMSPLYEALIRGKNASLTDHTDLVSRSGQQYHIASSAAAIRNANGEISGAILVFRDMTAEYNHREELAAALQKVEDAEKAKNCFLASMSHELRTPLNAVIGFAELLQNDQLPNTVRHEYVQNISTAGSSLLGLLNDILDLSKMASDQLNLTPVPTDLGILVKEIAEIFHNKCEAKKLTVELGIESMPVLLVDKLRLRQILFNLISNAVKFTEKGKIAVLANFQKNDSLEDGVLTIQVKDTGIGIAEKALPHIFEPFLAARTMPQGNDNAPDDTGLALTLVKQLTDQLSGQLTVESELHHGSIFTLVLPNVKFQNMAILTNNSSHKTENLPLNIKSLLLIDDVALNLKVLQALCKKVGIDEVETASGGQEGWTKLNQRRYDAVLTDLWMPDMNGLELAQKIHGDTRYADLPVVALTADVDARTTFSLGDFADVLFKPVTAEQLREVLLSLSIAKVQE